MAQYQKIYQYCAKLKGRKIDGSRLKKVDRVLQNETKSSKKGKELHKRVKSCIKGQSVA